MNEATYWRQRYEMVMANFADALKAAGLPPPPPIMLAEKESYEAGRIAGMEAQRKPWVGLTDKQIDLAIAELGLNYLADVANNRAVLRELCRKAANAKEEA